MNIRIVLFAILCVSIMLLSGAQLSSSEWSQLHSEQMTLMQQQAQTLVRVDTLAFAIKLNLFPFSRSPDCAVIVLPVIS